MRGENGVLVRGRWRPGPSGHTAGLEGHRFCGSGLGVAEVRGERVDGASMDTVRGGAGSGAVGLGAARVAGVGAEQGAGQGTADRGKQSRWVAFWEGACFVCCGVEEGEEGGLHPQPVTARFGRVGSGYPGPPFAR